jgi:hypothetical protein
MLRETELRDTKQQFLEALQDAFPTRGPSRRYYDLQCGQGNSEEDAVCVQNLASESLPIPADHFSEETEAE